MIDTVLLTAIRRFWTHAEVSERYEAIFKAYSGRLDKVTIIIGKTTGDDSANAQVIIQKEDYQEWMATLESRLAELENAAAGTSAPFAGTEHVVHSSRYVST